MAISKRCWSWHRHEYRKIKISELKSCICKDSILIEISKVLDMVKIIFTSTVISLKFEWKSSLSQTPQFNCWSTFMATPAHLEVENTRHWCILIYLYLLAKLRQSVAFDLFKFNEMVFKTKMVTLFLKYKKQKQEKNIWTYDVTEREKRNLDQ